MNTLSKSFNFKYSWRNYQERFLKDFVSHIEDDHLHIVAPPGSGKTVLGLEMLGRVNKKALVLSPTLTIRNQWKERMEECFLEHPKSDLSSFDIKNTSILTFTTYQSLHSFFRIDCNNDKDKLLLFFQEAGIETILLDEAHHLKNEWWKPLYCIKNLPNCTVISLTATPPYDSESKEIKKYFDLCGPIDMEIGVPELVREKNLCPHQDFVHFSKPKQKEIEAILKYRGQLMDFINSLSKNQAFITFIKSHPYYNDTEKFEEAIYSNTSFYSAILIFLNDVGVQISEEKINVLGIDSKKIEFPSFSYEWVTALLQPLIFDNRERYLDDEEILLSIEKQLRKIGGLQKNKINLIGESKLYKSLSQSSTKLSSIVDILKIESNSLKDDLRMVILSDYIRKEFLNFENDKPTSEINTLGVLPIFQFIRRKIEEDNIFTIEDRYLGVLTGSLIVVHQSLIATLKTKIKPDFFKYKYVGGGFVLITPTIQGKKTIVAVITSLFENGNIKVLIGTKSLLGEGWDAPAINTLILASFVGSFVMSNQMRGRAIRVNPQNPQKSANIWHLVCLDPTVSDGGADLKILKRRFEAFCGVSLTGDFYIENGAERLDILNHLDDIKSLNNRMESVALKRDETKTRWDLAIGGGYQLVRELKLDFQDEVPYQKQKIVYFNDALKYTIIELITVVTITLPELLLKNINVLFSRGVLYFIYAILAAIFMLFFPKMIKAVHLYLKYGRRDKQLIKITEILKNTLIDEQIIETPASEISVQIDQHSNGVISCYLMGATAKESIQFIDYLQEIINPVVSPRYLISQSIWFRKQLGFSNYYTVPGVFSEHKDKASLFFNNWKKTYSKANLLYTRNTKGRKTLLKARFQSYQPGDKIKSKKAMLWR
ncbi:hypothetical protein ULMS_02980 [Patiriisocius marinistellae]|uniref:Helicase ATP-binding domain-containing protein n=1 Tax=Patiriisocius marinistellae TaxID=2494560 RepID=A0A5J4FTA0_9FLAO|nr:DEAD/DEAH box helicase family protein [Patiriisocius marinistellae]GEQ84790.1 hypothetical protein ULMS_02980 [Patiriisocius marinistellae]